ncbi:MAG: hypothetical protein PUP93_34420 [Rhizonema sp. NSF051]|nr:hypothetical protein [Rhizonema sp. NSF051]
MAWWRNGRNSCGDRLTIFSLTLTLPPIAASLLFQSYLSRQSVNYIPSSNTGTLPNHVASPTLTLTFAVYICCLCLGEM